MTRRPDLAELRRITPPDLHADIMDRIERGEPRSGHAEALPSAPRKLGVVLLAFLVAVAGIGLIVHAFGTSVRRGPATSLAPVAPSNGDIYYVRGGGSYRPEFGAIRPDGTGMRIALASTDDVHYHRVAFSPDGARIAFADSDRDRSGIATAATDGSSVHRLTDGMNDTSPAWSPDGTKIAFAGTEFDPSIRRCGLGVDSDCATDIYVMNADGSGLVRLTSDPAPDYHPTWSPDGTQIAYATYRESDDSSISVMQVDGTEAHPVSSGLGGWEFSPTWSPDGSVIVFAAIRNGNSAIYEIALDGGGERVLRTVDGIGTPVWSPDGSRIAYTAIDPEADLPSLYTMRPDGSDATLVGTDPPIGIAGYITWGPVHRVSLDPTPSTPS
jgi:dipeptidyl aminopeptidase/acylaminoacyl peptidase